MPSQEELANFASRAAEIRTIAQGIFDERERQTLLQFVTVAEKLAQARARKDETG